jgi:hypothetical protein
MKIRRLVEDCGDSDMIVKSGERQWNLHKKVLSHASGHFSILFDSNFPVSRSRLI